VTSQLTIVMRIMQVPFLPKAAWISVLGATGCGIVGSSTGFADDTRVVGSGGTEPGSGTGGTSTGGVASATGGRYFTRATGGSDAGAGECTPFETRPCTALTGCASSETCLAAGVWSSYCACKSCTLPLPAGTCAWAIEDTFVPSLPPDRFSVTRTPSNGQRSTVPEVASEADCESNNGWYATVEGVDSAGISASLLTVTLCPSSCLDHNQLPEVSYGLFSGMCPIY
jgi:hypothetical protein